MPCKFLFDKDGTVKIRVRMKRFIDGVPHEVVNQRQLIPNLKITEADWKKYHAYRNENLRKEFLKDNELFDKSLQMLDSIRSRVDQAGYDLNAQKLRDIIIEVVNEKENEALKKIEEERKKEEEEKLEAKKKKEKMTLTKFIDQYIQDVKDGTRTTLAHGRTFVQGSRFSLTNSLGHFKEFMKDTGITYDFQDVDLDCYVKYKAWLMAQDISKEKEDPKHEPVHYADNTIGGFIKKLKCVLRAAESRGYPVNPAYKSTEFKAQSSIDVDTIYLTREEVERFEKVDLTQKEDGKNLELARDIFLVGVWTAQRVSDYNNLKPENIKVVDNNGTPMTYISIHQQKTGRLVEIPCIAKVREILNKYPKGLPHLSDQKINKYIKDIGKMAKIDEVVEVKGSRGGQVIKEYYKKYDLICTHTARRTGATLMYLDGIAIYDIMKVTGHKSVTTLEKYIRADKLEVAQKLVLQYDYFK
ncbi:MAG: phage integrase SAM-like domain-containing protein [Bacteroidaceae bacterium]|nr:phage integrase SAM-like domain-containing protein [Bacteroidaceae bacterium]